MRQNDDNDNGCDDAVDDYVKAAVSVMVKW